MTLSDIDNVRVIRAPWATSQHGARILADPDSPVNAPRFFPVAAHYPGPFYPPVCHLIAPAAHLEATANTLFGHGRWERITLADDPGAHAAAPTCPENDPFKMAGKLSDGPKRCATLLSRAGHVDAYATSCGAIATAGWHPSHTMVAGSSFVSGHEYDSPPKCENCMESEDHILSRPCPDSGDYEN